MGKRKREASLSGIGNQPPEKRQNKGERDELHASSSSSSTKLFDSSRVPPENRTGIGGHYAEGSSLPPAMAQFMKAGQEIMSSPGEPSTRHDTLQDTTSQIDAFSSFPKGNEQLALQPQQASHAPEDFWHDLLPPTFHELLPHHQDLPEEQQWTNYSIDTALLIKGDPQASTSKNDASSSSHSKDKGHASEAEQPELQSRPEEGPPNEEQWVDRLANSALQTMRQRLSYRPLIDDAGSPRASTSQANAPSSSRGQERVNPQTDLIDNSLENLGNPDAYEPSPSFHKDTIDSDEQILASYDKERFGNDDEIRRMQKNDIRLYKKYMDEEIINTMGAYRKTLSNYSPERGQVNSDTSIKAWKKLAVESILNRKNNIISVMDSAIQELRDREKRESSALFQSFQI